MSAGRGATWLRAGALAIVLGLVVAGVLLLRGRGAPHVEVPPDPAVGEVARPDEPLADVSDAPDAPGPEPEQEPAEGSASLNIRVLADETGDPVAGAGVEVLVDSTRRWSGDTGTGGEATMPPFEPTDVLVLVRHPDFLTGTARVREWELSDTADQEDPESRVVRVEVRLAGGVRITGSIRSAFDEAPVTGATILVLAGGTVGQGLTYDFAVIDDDEPPLSSAVTDAEGKFSIVAGEAGGIVTLVVTARGWSRLERSLVVPKQDDARAVELAVEPAASLSGTVFLPGGKPAEGATVYIVPEALSETLEFPGERYDLPWTWELEQHVLPRAITDDEGRYIIPHLLPGVRYLVLAMLGENAESLVIEDVAAARAGEELNHDLRLLERVRFAARVVGLDGAPVEAAGIELVATGENRSPGGYDYFDEGEFIYDAVTPGNYRLLVDGEGIVPQSFPVTVSPEGDAVELRLSPGCSITGIVADAEGVPVPGVRIFGDSLAPEPDGTTSGVRAMSDSRGWFCLSGLKAGPCRIRGRADGRTVLEMTVSAPTDDARVTAVETATVVFLLESEEELPPLGEIHARAVVTDDRGRQLSQTLELKEAGDRSGRLRVEGIRHGSVEFLVRAPGSAPHCSRFDLAPGERRDLGRITLSGGRTIEGVLKAADGTAVRDAEVRPYGSMLLATRTDESGFFRIPHVADGDLGIYVRASGYPVEMFRVRVGPEEPARHHLTLLRPGVLRGTVKTGSGERTAELLYVFVPERLGDATRQLQVCSDARGEFEIPLLPGQYVVQVLRGDQVVASEKVTVRSESTHRVALTVPGR